MKQPRIQIKPVLNEGVDVAFPVMQPATSLSAGYDVRAQIPDVLHIRPHESVLIPLGFAIYIGDANLCAKLYARSGLASKYQIALTNGTGLIDADYDKQVYASLHNYSYKSFVVTPQLRIAQLTIESVIHPEWLCIGENDEFFKGPKVGEFGKTFSERKGGFGSTGSE